jgi:transposase
MEEDDMRVCAAFSRLLRLDGVWVRSVSFAPDRVLVTVALRRRRLVCAHCAFSTPGRENVQAHESVWRHLDLGVWRLEIRATLRRVRCPVHGAHVEGVPFARHGARFTRDFEDLVAWLATKADRTAICRLVRIDWQTVGRIIQRVAGEQLDERRLDGLFDIGIDEIAWRGGHRYLTLVTDHHAGKIVWGAEGRSAQVADLFYDELGEQRAKQLRAVSLDMGAGYAKSTREHAPQATICIDPFHVVQLATRALDEVRRDYWNALRSAGDHDAAKRFKGARWVLLKNPANHTDEQARMLCRLRNAGGHVWRALTLKEAVRAIFAPDLDLDDVAALIDRFASRASRSRLKPFIRLAKTIRKHRDGILAAVRLKINNARVEALNNKARLITRRAYGFHSARAALALIHLSCGPITLAIPHQKTA